MLGAPKKTRAQVSGLAVGQGDSRGGFRPTNITQSHNPFPSLTPFSNRFHARQIVFIAGTLSPLAMHGEHSPASSGATRNGAPLIQLE